MKAKCDMENSASVRVIQFFGREYFYESIFSKFDHFQGDILPSDWLRERGSGLKNEMVVHLWGVLNKIFLEVFQGLFSNGSKETPFSFSFSNEMTVPEISRPVKRTFLNSRF